MRAKRFIGLVMTGMIAVAGILYGNVAEAAMNPAPAGQSSYEFDFITPGTTSEVAAHVTITKSPADWGKTITLKATVDVKDASQFKSNMYIWNGVASNSDTYTVTENGIYTFGLNGIKMNTNNQASVTSGTDGELGYEYHQHVDGDGNIVPAEKDNNIYISKTPGGCFGTEYATRKSTRRVYVVCGCLANYDQHDDPYHPDWKRCNQCPHNAHSAAGWSEDRDGDGIIDWTSGGCPAMMWKEKTTTQTKDFYDLDTTVCGIKDTDKCGTYIIMDIKNVDVTGPEASWDTNPKADTWTRGNVTVIITAKDLQPDGTDGCGLADAAYSYDGGLTWTSDNTYVMTDNGTHDVLVKDELGNQTKITAEVHNIDRIPPTAIIRTVETGKNGTVRIEVIAADGESGLAVEPYKFDADGYTATTSKDVSTSGKHTVIVRDAVGNAVECNDWLYMLHLDMNGGSYNGSKDEVIVTVPVYDDYDKFRVNTNGTKAGAVTGNITQRVGYVDDATGAFVAIGERTIPHEVAGEQLGVIDAYGAFNIDGVNGVYTRVSGDELQRFLGWSWDKDTKKPLDKYNVFNSARNGQFNIEEWSSDCATIVSEDAWNGHAGANLNPSGLGFGTHDYSYTIYGVWEPVLQVNMDLTRSLGDLSYSNPAVAQATRVTNVKASQRIAHVAGEALANNFDHTSCEEVHSVVLRTIIRPGEQGSYRVVTSGSIPETVTTIEFSHNITDIYNNGDSTSTWYDDLNPAVSDADGKYMVSGTIHPEHQNDAYVGIGVANDDTTSGIVKHGLNRLYSGKTRNIFNKFYTPKYFGTDKSYDTSKNVGATSGESGSTKYYIWATVSQPSIYYKWVYGSEENLCICGQIDVVTYSAGGGDSGGDKEIPSIPGGHAQNSEPTTLDELRSRLRIRIIGE